jgi:hypothetical protein
MRRTALSLADQTIEILYPDTLHSQIGMLFGAPSSSSAQVDHRISVEEDSGGFTVRVDDEAPYVRLNALALFDVLLEEVVKSLVSDLTAGVALHAASVAWQHKSILIAGPTGVGKTSLTAWFAANGFELLSDEIVVLPHDDNKTISFPRPLLAKSGSDLVLETLARSGRNLFLPTATSTLICRDQPLAAEELTREGGLLIFPRFVAGSAIDCAAVSPAMAGVKLMECNLNARNLSDHGLRTLTAFARRVPAIALTYGSYDQLPGVLDRLVKSVTDSATPAQTLRSLVPAWTAPSVSTADVAPEPAGQPAPQLAAAPFVHAPDSPDAKKLTIGMATYDDYDGVYFTIQAIRTFHPEILADTEFLLIDNHPEGAAAEPLKGLEYWIPNYRYIPKGEISGTAIRDCVFREARSRYVLCLDCHVLLFPGSLKRLLDYFDANPDTKDIVQGPLVYDDLRSYSTHFDLRWEAGMFGVWGTNPAGAEPDMPPFEIPSQGLGLFACRRTAWPGFNPNFRGFGGEEGYIHEKFRQRGGKALCLPFLRWVHRFNRPHGTRYPNLWDDRVHNYLVGFREIGWDTEQVVRHFKELLGEQGWANILPNIAPGLLPASEEAKRHERAPVDRYKAMDITAPLLAEEAPTERPETTDRSWLKSNHEPAWLNKTR